MAATCRGAFTHAPHTSSVHAYTAHKLKIAKSKGGKLASATEPNTKPSAAAAAQLERSRNHRVAKRPTGRQHAVCPIKEPTVELSPPDSMKVNPPKKLACHERPDR